MCIINSNAVWGRLSKNYLTQKFIERNIFIRNICDLRYKSDALMHPSYSDNAD